MGDTLRLYDGSPRRLLQGTLYASNEGRSGGRQLYGTAHSFTSRLDLPPNSTLITQANGPHSTFNSHPTQCAAPPPPRHLPNLRSLFTYTNWAAYHPAHGTMLLPVLHCSTTHLIYDSPTPHDAAALLTILLIPPQTRRLTSPPMLGAQHARRTILLALAC